MRPSSFRCLFLPAVLALSGVAFGQQVPLAELEVDSTALIRFTLNDGSVVQGVVWENRRDSLVVSTTNLGRLVLAKARVQSAERVASDAMHGDQYWFTNPHPSRHLLGPSAIPLRKGEGYYQNTYLLLNSFTVGVTNNISVGAGIELLSTFSSGSDGPIYFLTAKGSAKVAPKLFVGGAGLFLSVPGGSSGSQKEPRDNIGAATAMITYGKPDNQVTGGIGVSYDRDGLGTVPVITLSTQQRFANKTAFISENWIFTDGIDSQYFLSYGLRFMGERIAVDLAFINNADIAEEIFIGIPFVSFVVRW